MKTGDHDRPEQRSENVTTSAQNQNMTRFSVSQMAGLCRNKELNLSIQLAALALLWLIWLATAVLVVWRHAAMHGPPQYATYRDPQFIYGIVFLGMPLALVAISCVFFRRVKPTIEFGLGHHFFYRVVGFFNGLGIFILFVYCSYWVLRASGGFVQVRE